MRIPPPYNKAVVRSMVPPFFGFVAPLVTGHIPALSFTEGQREKGVKGLRDCGFLPLPLDPLIPLSFSAPPYSYSLTSSTLSSRLSTPTTRTDLPGAMGAEARAAQY